MSNEIIVITGGESGIGAATCRRFAGEGASVVIAGIDKTRGMALETELRSAGSGAQYVYCDVRDYSSVESMALHTFETYGVPTTLINNAGMALVRELTETSDEEFDQIVGVNLKGIYHTSRAFIPHMLRNGVGSIVNVASQLGLVAAPNFALYSATKAAVINLTRAMSLDYASEGLRVNCVCPGAVETPLLLNQFTRQDGPQGTLDDLVKMHPLGRIGRPHEIAAAISFLARDEASFITGSSLVVDGGYTAW